MPKPSASKQNKEPEKRPTILGSLISKQEPDKDYLPDLKNQWGKMDTLAKVKFVLGALVGLVIFVGTLILVYLILAGWI